MNISLNSTGFTNTSLGELNQSPIPRVSPREESNDSDGQSPREGLFNNQSFMQHRVISPYYTTEEYPRRWNNFIQRNETDPALQELEGLEELNIEHVTKIITKAKEIDQGWMTSFLRLAQKVARIAEWTLFIIGVAVAFISFFSLLTDPSPSLVLLSVIKGVGVGYIIAKLGPWIPNYTQRFFEWCEVKWTNYQLDTSLDTNDQRNTLHALKKWYVIRQEIEEDRIKVKHNINFLKKFDYRCDRIGNAYNKLHNLEGKILTFKDATDRMEKAVNRNTGGKQLFDYLEDRSFFYYIFQKA